MNDYFEERIVVREQIWALFGSFLLETLVVAEANLGAVHALYLEANRRVMTNSLDLRHQNSKRVLKPALS